MFYYDSPANQIRFGWIFKFLSGTRKACDRVWKGVGWREKESSEFAVAIPFWLDIEYVIYIDRGHDDNDVNMWPTGNNNG